MMKLIELVPSSIRQDPQVQAACEAIDVELDLVDKEIPQLAFWSNLDNIVPPLLDVLMWEYHVDVHQMLIAQEGEVGLTNELKRKLLNESIQWHQKKGTKWIIERALEVLFERIEVIEWYEYGGNPYFFKVIASSALNDRNLYNKVLAVIYELKNVRSWLEEFIIAKLSMLQLWEASVTVRWITNTIYMAARPSVSEQEFYVGMAVCIYRMRRINAPEI